VVGKPAIIERRPLQPGDVPVTYANVDRARAALGYTPTTPPELGVARYWQWLLGSGRM
jgi:UDP-glucuronate 4-epimerase